MKFEWDENKLIRRVRRCDILDITSRFLRATHLTDEKIMCTAHTWNMLYIKDIEVYE
ncbi:hypothetical protein QUA56_16860 [Microcoleus sp. N3A4]|uniref:hypothetical protein n=1 Tax=Microcoleus sp. N3A4 TaxID=3055379 RepID=UPI002FCFCDD2